MLIKNCLLLGLCLLGFSPHLYAETNTPPPVQQYVMGETELQHPAAANQAALSNPIIFANQWRVYLNNLLTCNPGSFSAADPLPFIALKTVNPINYEIRGWQANLCVVNSTQTIPNEDTAKIRIIATECKFSKTTLNLYIQTYAKVVQKMSLDEVSNAALAQSMGKECQAFEIQSGVKRAIPVV